RRRQRRLARTGDRTDRRAARTHPARGDRPVPRRPPDARLRALARGRSGGARADRGLHPREDAMNHIAATLPHPSLGDLVAANPAAAQVLERHGLDYCCHGDVPLDVACVEAGIDVATVEAELTRLPTPSDDGWATLSPPDL